MLITKNKQKELIKYITKQYNEMSGTALSELIECIEYTFNEKRENKSNSKRFSLDSDILDIFIVIDILPGRMNIVNWRPSDCPDFKYNGFFPACAKTHIIYIDE